MVESSFPPVWIAILGARFGIVFFCSGEGKGVRGARKGVGGVGFLLNVPAGGFSQESSGGGGGGEGPGGCLRGMLGVHQELALQIQIQILFSGSEIWRQAEYGFREHCLNHQTEGGFWSLPSSGERAR